MKKEKKKLFIDEMRSVSQNYSSMLLIGMEGLRSTDFIRLRSDLWSIDANMRVVKNNLLKIVLEENGYDALIENLNKQIAILYSDDIVSLSKLLYAFAKANNKVAVVGLIYQGEIFDGAKVERFARLPSLLELQAQIFGVLKHGVAGKLAGVIDGAKRRVPDMINTHARG